MSKFKIRKSRFDRISDCGKIIKKGELYVTESSIWKCEEGEIFYNKFIHTYDEYLMIKRYLYYEERRNLRFNKFLEKLENNFIEFKSVVFKYDDPIFRFNNLGNLEVTIEIRDMVTDDPFPMYDYFYKTYTYLKST